MHVDMSSLEWIASRACQRLKNMTAPEVEAMLVMVHHEGFSKAMIPETFLQEELLGHGLSPQDVQLDVVHVESHVHVHQQLATVVVGLGPDEHFMEPCRAEMFLPRSRRPVHQDEVIPIPGGTRHGFTVKPGGSLYFLSVRSSPIF